MDHALSRRRRHGRWRNCGPPDHSRHREPDAAPERGHDEPRTGQARQPDQHRARRRDRRGAPPFADSADPHSIQSRGSQCHPASRRCSAPVGHDPDRGRLRSCRWRDCRGRRLVRHRARSFRGHAGVHRRSCAGIRGARRRRIGRCFLERLLGRQRHRGDHLFGAGNQPAGTG